MNLGNFFALCLSAVFVVNTWSGCGCGITEETGHHHGGQVHDHVGAEDVHAQALLEDLDSWLGPHDRGVSGQEGGESVRTGVSIFYFEAPVQTNKSGDE